VALEVAEIGITANSVCPGDVLTPLVEKQIPDTAEYLIVNYESDADAIRAALPASKGAKPVRRPPSP